MDLVLLLVGAKKYFVIIDFIQKECFLPLSLSLYLRIHLWSISSPMFASLYLCHIVVLFICFLVEYHQFQNVKSSVTLCWQKQPTLTYTFSYMNINSLCFILSPINRFDNYKNNTNSTIPSSTDVRDDFSDHLFPLSSNYRYSF